MEAIREVRIVENGQVLLNLPANFWGQQVEIIILSTGKSEVLPNRKKSLRGCLRAYADPDLIPLEKDAWAQAMVEKYADR